MARSRKKAKGLTRHIPPEAVRDATVELTHALFGKTMFGRVVGRLIGEVVFSKAGGRRTRTATKEKTNDPGRAPLPKTKPVKLDNGVEYYPPERKKS